MMLLPWMIKRLLLAKKFLPSIITGIFLAWLLLSLREPTQDFGFDSIAFGKLPVLANGRLKPLDTVARTALLMIHGKMAISDTEGHAMTPAEWVMDVLMRPSTADTFKVFVIIHPDVLDLFHKDIAQGKYYSFSDLKPFLDEVDRQSKLSEDVPSGSRNIFQREILKLRDRILLYNQLKSSLHSDESVDFTDEIATFRKALDNGLKAFRERSEGKNFSKDDLSVLGEFFNRYQLFARLASIRPVPRGDAQEWKTVGDSLLETIQTGRIDRAIDAYATMTTAYRSKNVDVFNQAVADYRGYIGESFAAVVKKTDYEFLFNRFEPFYKCMILYVCVFLLALISWLVWPEELGKSAFWLLMLTFVVHTAGLLARMWLQGRPPVTNLYSSAIFVGWGACGLCIILEKIHRNGIGSLTAAAMGFITLLIAHHLSFEGDTMEMLRAVLDTNFWLATHVVAVTLGYASTFLAGFLAILYVVRGFFTTSLDKATAKSLNNMVYGIVCFATLFSFVGTILGGIWADQSWGRFWGFDPKENGALLIVIWNAIILHARWGGFIRERGLMNMAMFGNIVTSFSWFGVNMLGAGLHSYGFMDRAYLWLVTFDLLQLILISVGLFPLKYWWSFMSPDEKAASTKN